jgi:transporter family-2 protein
MPAAMIVAVIALGEGVPSLRVMAGVPWWAWSGGLFGGAFILLAILQLPSLGAATLFALVIAGQVLAAVTLDHFGAVELAARDHPGYLEQTYQRARYYVSYYMK